MSYYQQHLFFCTNQKKLGKKCCQEADADALLQYTQQRLKQLNLHGAGQLRVNKSGCLGRCSQGPCLLIYPQGIWYTYETTDDIDEIIEQCLLQGQVVERLLID